MKRTIKKGKDIGVAVKVQGMTVDILTRDKNGNSHFVVKKPYAKKNENGTFIIGVEYERWVASDYAFID